MESFLITATPEQLIYEYEKPGGHGHRLTKGGIVIRLLHITIQEPKSPEREKIRQFLKKIWDDPGLDFGTQNILRHHLDENVRVWILGQS